MIQMLIIPTSNQPFLPYKNSSVLISTVLFRQTDQHTKANTQKIVDSV